MITRDQWIAALRSGRYRQCQGSLHDDGAYCCLGVLLAENEIAPLAVSEDVASNVSPDAVRAVGLEPRWIEDETGLFCEDLFNTNAEMVAALLNDGGHTFLEIADWLEADAPTFPRDVFALRL